MAIHDKAEPDTAEHLSATDRGRRDRAGIRRWFAALSVYREPRLVAILLMGFSSGLPLALTGATLSLRLADIGVSLTAIGLFALVARSPTASSSCGRR